MNGLVRLRWLEMESWKLVFDILTYVCTLLILVIDDVSRMVTLLPIP